MRQISYAILVFMMMSSSCVLAADAVPPQSILDKIDFQLSARQWVTTQTALLEVHLNATLANSDLVKARADIMERLNKIAKGEWHLTAFDRSQDNSGLEKLYVQAQARVGQGVLTDIYKNAKAVSSPGVQYEIAHIDFRPSFEEIQAVWGQVRQQLYQHVNEELARINKMYPAQNYSVSTLSFVEGNNPSLAGAYQAKARTSKAIGEVAAASTPALTVAHELTVTALVEVASNRKQQ